MWRIGFSYILFLSCFVQAHTININDLKGQRLCISPDSIQVNILDVKEIPDAEQVHFVKEELTKSLLQTLDTYDIPYREKASCRRDNGFIYVLYQSNWGADTNGLAYLVFTASVQAGKMKLPIKAHFEYVLNDLIFENYTSALLFEDELPEPIHAGLVETNKEMMTELALGWWDSFELEQQAKQARQPILIRRYLALSVFLTSVIIALGVWLYSKR